MKWWFMIMAILLVMPLAQATLEIAPWYPQENSYIFECSADGFEAERFDWYFGDNDKLLDIDESSVYHTYQNPGTYEVSCTASSGEVAEVELLRIVVPSDEPGEGVAIKIAPWYPQENAYVFMCEAEGFDPDYYDWDFDDGSKLYDMTRNDVYHIFSPGEYEVQCSASRGEETFTDAMHIIVGGTPEEPTPLFEANLSIAPWFPQGLNYVFECETSDFEAQEYFFEFGDGEKLTLANNDVWHTYQEPGEYDVVCTAKADGMLAKGRLSVVAS